MTTPQGWATILLDFPRFYDSFMVIKEMGLEYSPAEQEAMEVVRKWISDEMDPRDRRLLFGLWRGHRRTYLETAYLQGESLQPRLRRMIGSLTHYAGPARAGHGDACVSTPTSCRQAL